MPTEIFFVAGQRSGRPIPPSQVAGCEGPRAEARGTLTWTWRDKHARTRRRTVRLRDRGRRSVLSIALVVFHPLLLGSLGWTFDIRGIINLTPHLTPMPMESGGCCNIKRTATGDFAEQKQRAASSGHRPVALLICGLWVRFPPGSPLFHQYLQTAPSS